ncbi:hypothetical protein ACGTNG_12605 [Halomonas sp. 1390]|uniref:hypothetical protein n=1 Tax=Halomonas sp. B23F22_3 TaxID=3459516 RepID=UPI00373FB004
MQKALTAIIDWFGPYTLEEAKDVTKFDYDDGLYMIIGKQPDERDASLQYVGLASRLHRRLRAPKHPLHKVTKEREIWLGEVVSPRTPGKKIKVTDRMLDLAEWSHAYFLQLPLNTQKRKTSPDRAIVTYNRWWKPDYETPYRKRPHRDWPDLIDFFADDYDAKIVWFGGRQIKAPVEEFCED